ncbi:hypothetical protein [Streptomyces ziwulingensis]|uniref:Uncharacterized protein n=1 Tax=Streptomyces ziwulingensis TaxID=1045501 RepID=A0ABP9CQD4_9ACTN
MTSKNRDGGGTAGRKRPWLPSRTRPAPPPVEQHHAPAGRPADTTGTDTARLAVRRVGHTWLVHPALGSDRQSRLFAAGLATDPEYTLVVVDLPAGWPLDAVEEAVAGAVPTGPRGLRVVFGRTPDRGAVTAGLRLAQRLGNHVVVPDGVVRPSAGGTLFIGADRGRGWVLCTPQGQVRYVSRRFPRPGWDESLPDRPRPVGPSAVAEPLGAGVWIRPVREDAGRHRHRGHLAARLRGRSDAPTVVIGAPGGPEPVLEDLAHFWRSLTQETAGCAPRAVLYGPVRRPGGRPFGAALAALTGEPVHVYNGFPVSDPLVGRAPSDEVLLLGGDGTPGRPVFAREYLHLPPEPGAAPHPMLAVDHRWPLGHLPMLRQGLYRGGPSVALEVLPWGLWIRPSVEPAHAEAVRAAPADPHHELILCDDSVPGELPRLQRLAEDVVRRLPAESGLLVRVLTAARPWGAPADEAAVAPAAGDGGGGGGGMTAQVGAVQGGDDVGRDDSGRVVAVDGPSTAVAVREPGRALPATPAGPRPGAGSPKDAAVVAMALRHDPGLSGDLPPEAALAGLVAVRLQLTVHGWHAGLEEGRPGAGPPPVDGPALAGLALLPVHRGVVAVRTDLDRSWTGWYEARGEVVTHRVFAASLTGNPGRPGNADILIRSVTGRRTALLEPERPDRVLFPPGTRFEVVEVRDRPGERVVVLLSEIPAVADRRGRSAPREFEEALRVWRADEESGVVRDPAPDPFAGPPGPAAAPGRFPVAARPVALSGRFR